MLQTDVVGIVDDLDVFEASTPLTQSLDRSALKSAAAPESYDCLSG